MDKPELLLMSQRERDRLKFLHEVQRGHLTPKQGGAQLGLTARWVRELLRRLKEEGDPGVMHRARGRPSNRRLPEALRERAVARAREDYGDFGPTLAAECLGKREGIQASKETLRQWMIAAGVWKARARRVAESRRLTISPPLGEGPSAPGG
jgi:predicted ArsR family transcriptional regulator